METRPLGRTDLNVSVICLGTMTFGEQNSEAEAHEQLDYATSQGVNFIDTAEMYPVPPRAETQGSTEAYVGSWLARRGRRDDLMIATKVTGPGQMDRLFFHGALIAFVKVAPVTWFAADFRIGARNIIRCSAFILGQGRQMVQQHDCHGIQRGRCLWGFWGVIRIITHGSASFSIG